MLFPLLVAALPSSLLFIGCIADYSCPEDQVVCRGVCVDTQNDPENCGTCGNICAEDEVCGHGGCTKECPSGYVKCGRGCVNLMADENNCGACGNTCGTLTECTYGACSCVAGYSDCDGLCVDLSTDPENCGACSVRCPAGDDCVNGRCINQDCPRGQMLCGRYCVDLTTDENNCGACGNVCGASTECVDGFCACVDGYADCGGVCVNLQWDASNCGSCRLVCANGEFCIRGACQSTDAHTIGLWHMDEQGNGTTTLYDSSGFGNHLVRSDASENVVGNPGRFGYAVGGWAHVLNIGDDRDAYFADTSLAGTSGLTELTFEFWLKLPADGVRNDPNPFGLGDDDDDRFRIADDGRLQYDNEGIQGPLSTLVIPFGTWNHVALTWDADYARIWLNGGLAAQLHSTGVTPITFLRLGGQHPGNTNFSSGYVDEARLSDVVLYTSPFEPPQAPFGEPNRDIVFTPVEWTIDLDTHDSGVHTIFMIADVRPLGLDNLQGLGGNLIWDETEVVLCSDPNVPPQEWGKFISVREVGNGYLRIGDGFQTNFQGTGCEINDEMDSTFNQFGLPETACLWVRTGGLSYEYCAPLIVQ